MDTSLLVSSAGSYLNAEWRGFRAPWRHPSKRGAFVTISREAGSGRSSLARLLARKLNAEAPDDVMWHIFEDNLTPTMLKAHHLPTHLARFLPEDRISEVQASIGEFVGLHPSLWDLVQKTNETMRDLAQRGHVILVGRGSNFATAGIAHGVHVRLAATKDHRANYLVQRYGISHEEALACNARCDLARHRYVKSYFDANDRDLAAYDMVLNSARVSLPDAAKIIATRVHSEMPTQWP
jgi:cytidylate kinase